jgi:hypothetical protein
VTAYVVGLPGDLTVAGDRIFTAAASWHLI